MGKKLTSQFLPRGKNGPARFFPGEKTDWGEIPACYTGLYITLLKSFPMLEVKEIPLQLLGSYLLPFSCIHTANVIVFIQAIDHVTRKGG